MKPSPITTAAHPSYMSDLTEITALHQIDKTHTPISVVFMLQRQSAGSPETASVQWSILSKPWPHKPLLQSNYQALSISLQLLHRWKLVQAHLHVAIVSHLCSADKDLNPTFSTLLSHRCYACTVKWQSSLCLLINNGPAIWITNILCCSTGCYLPWDPVCL